jgi:stage II sporulation protein AA (anti-sigma F factor antagonist)
MSVTLLRNGQTLTAYLSGDLDHHSAAGVRSEIDHAVRTSEADTSKLILDFADVSFMDSSGIGLVMGRYKLMSELGGVCIVANPPAYIGKVMRISGISRLCEIVTVHSANRKESNEETDGGVKL